jgi:hypothetical protein
MMMLLLSEPERITLSADKNTITLLPTAIHINAPYMLARAGDTNPSGFMKRLTGKAAEIGKDSRLGFMLIGGEDILQYYAKPENKRHFSDLAATIGLDTGNYIVSSILAGAAIGLVIGALALGGMEVMSAAIIAFFGLILAGFVNAGLDWLEDKLGITDEVHELAAKCGHFLEEYWPTIEKALDESEAVRLEMIKRGISGA